MPWMRWANSTPLAIVHESRLSFSLSLLALASLARRYELVPHGMVSRVRPKSAAPETIDEFELRADAAMAHVLRALPTLPVLPGDDAKYSEETVYIPPRAAPQERTSLTI